MQEVARGLNKKWLENLETEVSEEPVEEIVSRTKVRSPMTNAADGLSKKRTENKNHNNLIV